MTNKMKIWSLVAIGVAVSGWEFLPWWFCDVVATIGGICTFVFVYIRVMKK